MNSFLKIPKGSLYQECDCLIDLLDYNKAIELEALATSNGWQVIQSEEAYDMGFKELVEWSIAENDILILVNHNYLVCIPKKLYNVHES